MPDFEIAVCCMNDLLSFSALGLSDIVGLGVSGQGQGNAPVDRRNDLVNGQ